ncbi:PepSY domain-containing protein [Polaribacter sp. Hel_I_88]|uniref:PepSY-associated TM helix domain-containing protein n=1 Tax=Polaribacter sp. Hel_I_88 TaxID=1250006 RepID=UPI00047884DA|nr:PepSY-associated TM helix domain-containing protein [Polaribacter sp. Hel_I_88]
MKKLQKKDYFAIHSWIGVQLSIIFFIVCFSGTLAVFSHELDWIFNSEMRASPQKELASKNKILNQLKTDFPKQHITFWEKSREEYLVDIVHLENDEGAILYVFANPYTGKIQGSSTGTIQRFFRDLHYNLFIPTDIGNYIVLLFGFLLLGSLISGLKFINNKRKHSINIGKKNNALAYTKNLHKTFAIWSIPFIMLFSVTGIWYFTERANLFSIADYIEDQEIENVSTNLNEAENFSYSLDYDAAIKSAKSKIPNFTFGSFVISDDEKTIEVRGNSDSKLARYRANRVVIDPQTNDVVFLQKATETNALMTINNLVDPIHFGYFGGLFTKAIWFIFGLLICYLAASGIWIYLKRISKNKKGTYTFRYLNWFLFAVIQFFMYSRLILEQHISLKNHCIILFFWLLFIYLIYHIFYKKIRA